MYQSPAWLVDPPGPATGGGVHTRGYGIGEHFMFK